MSEDTNCSLCVTIVKTNPVPEEIEMYNLTVDPIETQNLANPQFSTAESTVVQVILANLLTEQCKKKRLYPSSEKYSSKSTCQNCSSDLFKNL